MIRSVRAAGFAAAAFVLAATAAWSGPLQAVEGDAAPAATYYTDHDGAAIEVADFAANADQAAVAAPTPAASAPTAPAPASSDHDAASADEPARQSIGLADITVPRIRPLGELVESYAGLATDNGEQDCLASAVYFEARGEPIEGQLAVAEVVLNRAQSGRYPRTVCQVVTQPWQFSFVRRGHIPAADRELRILAPRRRHRPHRRSRRPPPAAAQRALVPCRLCPPELGPPPRPQHQDRPPHLLQLGGECRV